MLHSFETFIKQLKDTHISLGDFVDFHRIESNIDKISIKLNQLNYLLGQQDMHKAVSLLWAENPKAFSVLDILIAVRSKDNKKVIDNTGNIRLIKDYLSSPSDIVYFLDETGLSKLFREKKIKNLVDYVFGIEVGLDTNARKNRGGHIMEKIVAITFQNHQISFKQEVDYSQFSEVKKVLGADKKRFDFVIETKNKIYLIETNFYTTGGSKLNEVARAYSEIAPKINAIKNFEFVWITDGKGWLDAKNKLEEAFYHIPSIYNLTTLSDFINHVKQEN